MLYIIIRCTHNTLPTIAKAENRTFTVCILINGEQFQSAPVTLTKQCSMSKTCELFSYSIQYVQVQTDLPIIFSYRAHSYTRTDR